MKRILILCAVFVCVSAHGAARTSSATRATPPRANSSAETSRSAATASAAGRTTATRSAAAQRVASRSATTSQVTGGNMIPARQQSAGRAGSASLPTIRQPAIARSAIAARATTTTSVTETKTGAAYEQCKNAYFACMDQFCAQKDDNYKRCSCSDRVYDLGNVKSVMQDASVKLTEFTENIDAVGMSSAQATAMRVSSEGENALTSDTSASKALLQAIMNSIRGEDATVGGKYADLNSVNMSFDTSNMFGMQNAGQALAQYNGKNLYTAIYGQCRTAVAGDCNDASLQRAVTAYLMAIEQDCNTVQKALDDNKKKMTAAVREGSAMLDLARVENRRTHNSDEIIACIKNVETAVQSEEVCGAGYRKCLDNGKYINITTGAPIAGVTDFYKLQEMLTFADGMNIEDQQLSKLSQNKVFVQNFENRVKKFAAPALDKCVEKSDIVWADYLDKALIDIYYAQRSKVAEIKEGCFNFISTCYSDTNKTITASMKELAAGNITMIQPSMLDLTGQICTKYVESCEHMFGDKIISSYIAERKNTDTIAACRAVARQCFDKFGGKNFENFYNPYGNVITTGYALDWFSLYDWVGFKSENKEEKPPLLSECAKELAATEGCKDNIEKVFGGTDRLSGATDTTVKYGRLINDKDEQYAFREKGVANEVYYNVIAKLSTDCMSMQGRFVTPQFYETIFKGTSGGCLVNDQITTDNDKYKGLEIIYGYQIGENMCPKGYESSVDVKSWGACLCWENGARRSFDGVSVRCEVALKSNGMWVAYKEGNNNNTVGLNTEGQVCLLSDGTCEGVSSSVPKSINN